MSDVYGRIKELFKKPKLLIAAGCIGILLIALSSVKPSGGSVKADDAASDFNCEKYKDELQLEIEKLVNKITGYDDCTVVLTLESGVKYTYASANEKESSSSSGKNVDEVSSNSSESYITVKSANGGEEPLIISELLPEVRGVAVVCSGGDDEKTREKITEAITAALNITSKRVSVLGGNRREKG